MDQLIHDALLLHISPPKLERADIRIREGKIAEVGQNLKPSEGEEQLSATGQLIMPGLVVGHHHLYSALASTMPAPPRAPENFHDILKLIWWRVDRALDGETIRLSALAGAMEAAFCGVTTIIDHHASPNFIEGSLDFLAAGIKDVGLRSVLCYEVTGRNNGSAEENAGLQENRAFADKHKGPKVAGMIGAHAAFTMSDDALKRCQELADQLQTGVHIHVAEDPCDDAICREKYGAPLWERLKRAGLITKGNIFGHGTHLTEGQIREAGEAGVTFAHNTRSNMNNGVGYANLGAMLKHAKVLLGTDGIGSDMLEEFRAATFKSNDGHTGAGWDDILGMLANNAEMASHRLGVTLGRIEPGAEADLVLCKLPPAMPANGAGSPAGHLLFSLASRHVEGVMIAGNWTLWEKELLTVPYDETRRQIADALPGLWKRLPAE